MGLLPLSAQATGGTFTWVGGGGDQLISNPANWQGGVAPGAGDSVVFPPIAAIGNRVITVDTNTAYGLAEFNGDCTGTPDDYTFTGTGTFTFNSMLNNATGCSAFQYFQDPVQVTGTNPAMIHNAGVNGLIFGNNGGPSALTFDANAAAISLKGIIRMGSVLTGAGNITLDPGISPTVTTVDFWSNSPAYTGNVDVKGDTTLNIHDAGGLGSTAGSTTLEDVSSLQLFASGTISEPITINGTPTVLGMQPSSGTTLTLDGSIQQTTDFANVNVNGAGLTLNITGCGSGHTLSASAGSTGTLYVNLASCVNGRSTTTIPSSDSQPAKAETISANHTLIVDGTRGDITVQSGGILGGHGTVGTVTVQSGGTLAPGNSPGCLASGNVTLVSGANFNVDIAGATVCTEYDQQVVTGTVDLGSATLNLNLTYVPAAGTKFKVISNDAADPIVGAFAGLTEGATVTANGYNFTISYLGGDGNDVELTAVGPAVVPALPAAAHSNSSAPLLLILFALMGVAGIEIGRRVWARR